MEDSRPPSKVHPKIRELIDFTMMRCVAAIQRISAYRLSLAEMGAIREVISVALKTAFMRGLIAQDEKRENYLEPWNPDNEPTDPYPRTYRPPSAQPTNDRLWDALKRRANRSYSAKRSGASPTELLRGRRPK
jgi:hypothetical protein